MRSLRLAMMDRIERKLPRVRAPLLVMTGSRDPIAPPQWAERVALLAPGGRFVQIPGGPHGVNFSRPRDLADVVRHFLKASRKSIE
jgi:pimeloyl-ACP methyl ester carboxylesterase